jgi:hypothetical protein
MLTVFQLDLLSVNNLKFNLHVLCIFEVVLFGLCISLTCKVL